MNALHFLAFLIKMFLQCICSFVYKHRRNILFFSPWVTPPLDISVPPLALPSGTSCCRAGDQISFFNLKWASEGNLRAAPMIAAHELQCSAFVTSTLAH